MRTPKPLKPVSEENLDWPWRIDHDAPVEPADEPTELASAWYDVDTAPNAPVDSRRERIGRRVELAMFVTLVVATVAVVIWLALS